MRTILKSVFAITAFATLALAADKPNFSGDWAVNFEKSNLGPMAGMAPTSMTRKVDHSDPAITVTQASVGGPQGDQTVTLKYSTDGKETTNEMMGSPVKSVTTWDGEALLIKTKLEIQGMEISLTDKWALSDAGKTLTDTSHIVSPQGEFDVVYVLAKK